MNRPIQIVICDFLLVSLLAFSTVDINKVANPGREQRLQADLSSAAPPETGRDLAAVMGMALEEERKSRDLLMGELNRTRESLDQQQGLLSQRDQQVRAAQSQLTEREQQIRAVQAQLVEREQQMRTVQAELTERERQVQNVQQQLQSRERDAARLQQEQTALQQQFSAAQTNLQNLTQQLRRTSTDAVMSQEKLAALEEELRKQAAQAAALQRQMTDLARSNEVVISERQQLATQLQVAEVERRHATEQVVRMQDQVRVEREERARLAEGVQALASRSTELAEEIRENRPLTANSIFNEFVTNRVSTRMIAARPGMFGTDASRRKDTTTVLVTDGTNTYALCHVDETPLALWTPGTDWDRLTGSLVHARTEVPIRSLSFHFRDPRIVWMPVSEPDANALGSKIYRLSSDPFKFQDAVLVGAQEGYYGECRFEIDVSTPEHVRLDRNVLKGWFGKFNPSRGDLVFSKTGELLGIMANSTYCMRIRDFEPGATFRFDRDIRSQRTGQILSALHSQVGQLPARLQ